MPVVIRPAGKAAPIIAHLPHASTVIPADVRAELVLSDDELPAGKGVARALGALGLADGFAKRIRIGDIAVHLFQGAAQQPGGIITLAGIKGRGAAVGLPIGVHKLPVGRVVQVVGPLRTIFHTNGRILDCLQQAFVKGECGPEYRDGLIEAGLGVLFEKIDAHAAGQEEKNGVRFGGAQGSDFRGVIRLSKFGVNLTGDGTLVVALESGQVVLAGRIVGRQQVDLLKPGFGDVFTHDLIEIVVLVGHVEVIHVAVLAGQQ